MSAPLLYLLFFLSGVSGLVYQVVWVRQFGNLFGNTVWSASLVTAIFMCGLGVGGLVAGRLADRLHAREDGAPLRLYAQVELGIAALGLLVALALPFVGRASGALSSYTPDATGWFVPSVASQLWRYLLALVLLGPITLLMGGTLTLLIRHQVGTNVSTAGWHVGALYGVNTAGAALGAFLTDLALVPTLGVRGTQFLAVVLNATVGLVALLVLRRATAAPRAPAPAEPAEPATEAPGDGRLVHLAGLALALSGFAAMGMEMLWFRFFSTLLGGFRSVFSLLLAVLLVGMWLGATLAGALVRRLGRPALLQGLSLMLLVVTSLGLLASVDADAVRAGVEALSGDGWTRRLAEHRAHLAPMLFVVGLPSVLMGMAFPLANALVQRASAAVGGRAGGLYLWNTAGAVLGSLGTGFVLLPALGMQRCMLALALLSALALLPLALASGRVPGGAGLPLRQAGALLAVCVLALVGWSAQPADTLVRQGFPIATFDEVRVLATSEGPNETLLIAEVEGLGRALYTNGHTMSGTVPRSQRYMRAMAHVPLLQQEAPRRVVVICFGVGNTVHAASMHPSVERLDVVDLSRNVLSHAHHFASTNGNVLKDQRVSIFVNDGRQHLRMQPEGSYELITLEPPPIAFAGVGSLYSREFYELARSRLSPGGYVTQWLPAYQVPADTTRAMVRAFLDVFPNGVLLAGYGAELILMGSNGPAQPLRMAEVLRRLEARPAVKADLARIELGTPLEYAGLFAASSRGLERLAHGVAPVTDDWPITEYSVASRGTAMRMPAELFALEDLRQWCVDCDDPRLDAYAEELQRRYAQEEFLSRAKFALPSPP